MRPADLLVKRDGDWFCKECDYSFGSEKSFAMTVIPVHARNHGVGDYSVNRVGSSGGGCGGSVGGSGLIDAVLDIVFGD